MDTSPLVPTTMMTEEQFTARCKTDNEFAESYEDYYHYVRLENARAAGEADRATADARLMKKPRSFKKEMTCAKCGEPMRDRQHVITHICREQR